MYKYYFKFIALNKTHYWKLAPHPLPSPEAGTLPTRSLRITQLTQGWVLLILHENPNTLRDQGDATAPLNFHQK